MQRARAVSRSTSWPGLGWVGAGTWVSIETAKQEEVEIAGFTVDATRVHGKARLTLLRQA